MAEVQRITRNAAAALPNLKAALAIFEQLAGRTTADRDLRVKLADTHLSVAEALRSSGDVSQAFAHAAKALEIWEGLLPDAAGASESRRGIVNAAMLLGDMEREQRGDWPRALSFIERALRVARELAAEFPEDRQCRADLASALNIAGHFYASSPEPRQALPYYQQSLAIVEALSASDPADARMRRSVGIHNTNLALVLDKVRDDAAAEARYRRSLEIHAALVAVDPQNSQYLNDLAFVRSYLGLLLVRTGIEPPARSSCDNRSQCGKRC